MYELHDYRPGDEHMIFKIVKYVLEGYGLSVNPEVTDSDLADIRKSYISRGGTFRVLEFDGMIIGSYGLYASSPWLCELRKMYLLPGFRGQGLGRKMMDDAMQKARELGFTEMFLETNSRLNEAMQLYKKYGFTEFDLGHLSDRCDLAMKKTL